MGASFPGWIARRKEGLSFALDTVPGGATGDKTEKPTRRGNVS